MDKEEKYSHKDELSGLIKASYTEPSVPDDFERRVMLSIARRAIAHSKRKAKFGLIASLSGLAMLLAGCVAILINWLPGYLPLLKKLQLPAPEGWLAKLMETSPFLEQWGGWLAGWLVILLLLVGAAGFIYYLNSLFSNTYIPGDK